MPAGLTVTVLRSDHAPSIPSDPKVPAKAIETSASATPTTLVSAMCARHAETTGASVFVSAAGGKQKAGVGSDAQQRTAPAAGADAPSEVGAALDGASHWVAPVNVFANQ